MVCVPWIEYLLQNRAGGRRFTSVESRLPWRHSFSVHRAPWKPGFGLCGAVARDEPSWPSVSVAGMDPPPPAQPCGVGEVQASLVG